MLTLARLLARLGFHRAANRCLWRLLQRRARHAYFVFDFLRVRMRDRGWSRSHQRNFWRAFFQRPGPALESWRDQIFDGGAR